MTSVRSVSNTGHQTTTADFNGDGSQVTVTSNSLRLLTLTSIIRTSVYDTNTGRQIGRTVVTRVPAQSSSTADAAEADDGGSPPILRPDGSRALTITDVSTPTGINATSVTVTDTATGLPVGGAIKLRGYPAPEPVLFGPDGTHAIITTETYDGGTPATIMLYSTIDTETGVKAGTTLALRGSSSAEPVFSVDGERVVFTSYGAIDDTYTYQTQLGILDTTTGAQIGSTLTYSSARIPYPPVFSGDRNRALMLNGASDPLGRYGIRASMVNTVTGTQIGKTLAFAGGNFGASGVLSPDGAHALIVTVQANLFTLTSTTRVSILKIA